MIIIVVVIVIIIVYIVVVVVIVVTNLPLPPQTQIIDSYYFESSYSCFHFELVIFKIF